jgi:hypothetical protein
MSVPTATLVRHFLFTFWTSSSFSYITQAGDDDGAMIGFRVVINLPH